MAATIRELRLMAGLSQFDVAKVAGVGRTRLSLAECGHVQLNPAEMDAVEKALMAAIEKKIAKFNGMLLTLPR